VGRCKAKLEAEYRDAPPPRAAQLIDLLRATVAFEDPYAMVSLASVVLDNWLFGRLVGLLIALFACLGLFCLECSWHNQQKHSAEEDDQY